MKTRRRPELSCRALARSAACLAAAALPLLAGCSSAPEGNVSAAPTPGGPRKVGVVTVQQHDIPRLLSQPGTIEGVEEAALYAKASGYLKEIHVDRGDRVRKGQVIAVIESPELFQQRAQAQAAHQQSLAATQGAVASKGRAQADVEQAKAATERARADARQGDAVISRAEADLATAEAQLPKLRAVLQGAEAGVQGAIEQQAQAQAEVARWQQQIKSLEASVRASQSALQKAEADRKLQQLTYQRLKSIQDRDAGLVTAQDVDVARARMDTSESEMETVRNRVDAARSDVETAKQQLEGAQRQAAAAGKRIDAARSQAAAAREDLQIAQKEIESARQQVKVAQAQREAAGSQINVAESQRRAVGAQVRVADAQIAAARSQSQGSKSALSAATTMAGYTRILAPFDGVVTDRLADPGAFVQNASGNQAGAKPVVKVVRDQRLQVVIPLPEADAARVRPGQPAAITVASLPDETFRGRVSRLASAVDPRSRTMQAEVDLDNPGGRLRPGTYAHVSLTLGVERAALSVPTDAVMGPEDKRFVYTVVDGHAKKTLVTLGTADGKSVQVKSGLQPGAQVVTVGRDTLVDGAAVTAEPAPAQK